MNRKIKLIHQKPMECSVTSIRMLTGEKRKRIISAANKVNSVVSKVGREPYQLDDCSVGYVGVLDLLLTLKRLGYSDAVRHKGTVSDCKRTIMPFPCIARLGSTVYVGDNGNHSVVLNIRKGQLLVLDPNVEQMEKEEIRDRRKRLWDNIVELVYLENSCEWIARPRKLKIRVLKG